MNLPNYLTLLRVALAPIFLSFIIYTGKGYPDYRWWAFGVFAIAVLTDALDGFIARRFNMRSELGTFLDPFADKLLLLSGFLGIAFTDAFHIKPPIWAVVVIVFRDVFIIGGLIAIFFSTGHVRVAPNFLGKLTTVSQMLTIGVVLLDWKYSYLCWDLALILTIISAISYARKGIQDLNVSK